MKRPWIECICTVILFHEFPCSSSSSLVVNAAALPQGKAQYQLQQIRQRKRGTGSRNRRGGGVLQKDEKDDDDDHVLHSKTSKTSRQNSPATTARLQQQQQQQQSMIPAPLIHSFLRQQRPVSLLRVLRILSGIFMTTSLLACLLTFGDPHRQSVWSILHRNDPHHQMPFEYQPTHLDLFLAQRQLQSDVAFGAVLLPPWFLPATGPLLGLLGSILFVLVGMTVLLPRWWTPAKVFLSFAPWTASGIGATNHNPTHVLVRLPQGDHASRRRRRRHSSTAATAAAATPLGNFAICQFHTCSTSDQDTDHLPHGHPYPTYFEHGFCRYYCDTLTGDVIEGGPDLHLTMPLSQLLHWKGLVDVNTNEKSRSFQQQPLQVAKERFGPYAKWTLPQPTLAQALTSRLSSPLVVVQLLGRLLNLLEEGISSSITQVLYTLGHHYWNARQAIVAAKELATEVAMHNSDGDDLLVWVFRPQQLAPETPSTIKPSKKKKKKKPKNKVTKNSSAWQLLPSLELLPGDVFLYPIHHVHNKKNSTSSREFPVDALLLQGQCITNEAVLTGESVPQTKIPVIADDGSDGSEETKEEYLDMMGKHRSSMLFAGTTVLHCTTLEQEQPDSSCAESPGPGIKCLALRTGLYSSKGEIIRSLSAFKGHVGSVSNAQGDQDALRLMGCLSLFAMASCFSLFVVPTEAPTSSFRRVIQCTRIAIASIPSDLPLALAAVTRSCAQLLRNDAQVVCSDPGSMLTAAQVDVIVFDKTGTLTADTQSVAKIVSCSPDRDNQQDMVLSHNSTISPWCSPGVVLAGCHSLVQLDEDDNSKWVGDPLDLAALKYSQWSYDSTLDCYHGSLDAFDNEKEESAARNCKLWQIKTFPFDPNLCTSSALVLVELSDGQRGLYKVIKGSPDTLQSRLSLPNSTKIADDWYETTTSKLDTEGSRTIAMGMKQISYDDALFYSLLPKGVANETEYPLATLLDQVIRPARVMVTKLSRAHLEDSNFDFAGFSCFNAAIRPSTRRVIQALRKGGVHVTMLTGDAMDAAILVAATSGLIDTGMPVVVLESTDSNKVVYRTMTLKSAGKHSKPRLTAKSKAKTLTSRRLKELLAKQMSGELALAATGNAVDVSTKNDKHAVLRQLARNLHLISVVGRASPKQKQSLVQSLRDTCEKVILMCGDGVNDVAAMKSADVGVALLNGFGDESMHAQDPVDLEDERRRQRLQQRRIGSNRKILARAAANATRTSQAAAQARISAYIQVAQQEIRQRAATRQGLDIESPLIQYTLSDVKDLVASIIEAGMKERRRSKLLQKGGGDAARILAQEDGGERGLDIHNDTSAWSDIKPGEASLAAPFSCLRPSIDGADALMRGSLAASAFSLSLKQTIALNCLMSCYNLATLYRDGFRYGKNMWKVELFLYMMVDRAIYVASCTPRPHLSIIRPPNSMFEVSSALSVAGQALVHLITLTVAVQGAGKLERVESSLTNLPHMARARIRSKQLSLAPKFSSVVNALVSSHETSAVGHHQERGLLGRPEFRPNYETNVVFFLSVMQNLVSNLVNHKGAPYYASVLESRSLCLTAGLAMLGVVACIAETFPAANAALQLRPWPSRRHKLSLLAIVVLDASLCFLLEWLLRIVLFRPSNHNVQDGDDGNISRRATTKSTAADEEEMLLKEEAKENRNILMGIVAAMMKIVTDMLVSGKASS